MSRRWIVAQIGAREHYAVPRALHAQGRLRLLFTEAWCRRGGPLLRRGPHTLRALAGRRHADLPDDRVVAFTMATVWDTIRRATSGARAESWHPDAMAIGEAFCRRVNERLAALSLDPGKDVFFGYDTGCLETLQLLHERGIPTVVDQIDPGQVEWDMVREEARQWPGWQALPDVPEAYWDRLRAEWAAATVVLVNSPWSREALIRQGVPEAKIRVVPLAYEGANARPGDPKPSGPLTVLWVGSVILRKGIQYLIDAARRLSAADIRIVVAGQILIDDRFVREAPPSIEFVGEVSRDRVGELYREADVYVLPTISDGFGLTQLEAMGHGLPVVTTPNSGDVVRDGRDGLIVPIRDPDALASAIGSLDQDRALLAEMSREALDRVADFSLAAYADQLTRIFD